MSQQFSDISPLGAQIVLQKYVEGTPQLALTLGKFQGGWAQLTRYELYDMVRNDEDDHIWLCTTAHTSGTTFDASKWGVMLSLEPFQTITAEIIDNKDALDATIAQANNTATELNGLLAGIDENEAEIAAEIRALALADLALTAMPRPILLSPATTPDLTDSFIVVDKVGWAGARQILLSQVITALAPGGIADASGTGPWGRDGSGNWIEVAPSDYNLSFLGLLDVDTSAGAPADGDFFTWDDVAGKLKPQTIALGISRIADATDVTLTAPTANQTLLWDAVNSKFVNAAVPSTGLATSSPFTTLTGPVTHTFAAGDAGKDFLANIAGGDVIFALPAGVTTPAGETLQALIRTTGGNGVNKLVIQSAAVTPPVVNGTPILGKKTSGVSGTPIAQVDTDIHAVTVTAGTDCGILAILAVNASDTAAAVLSTKLNIAGVDYDWDFTKSDIVGGAPRVWVGIHPLGNLGVNTAYNVKAKMTDYGSGGTPYSRMNSYELHLIPLKTLKQTSIIDGTPVTAQNATGVLSKDATVNANLAGDEIFFFTVKRNNSPNTAISSTGVPVLEGATHATNTSGAEERALTARKDAAVGSNTITITYPSAAAYSEAHFALKSSIVAGVAMRVTADASPQTTVNNKAVAISYDGNNAVAYIDM